MSGTPQFNNAGTFRKSAGAVTTSIGNAIAFTNSGAVEALSGVVSARGGNWEKSHMTQLAGKFAGVVLVTVPSSEVDGFLADLAPLVEQGLFDIVLEKGVDPK